MGQQSKPLQNQQEPKTIQQLIQDFNKNLEIGDFGLSKIIKYGYLVYGQTRSGKTAASHLLSGNALKGVKISGEEKVQTSTSKNRKAVIGNKQNSQTRVPNMFEIKDPNNPENKAYVIDTPGYGDTYGTFRLLGNGYYHYKLYSKVQNMKFILCFDTIQLQNTAQLFIDTIVQFTSYFKDYKEERHSIWKSCVFLINKIDETQSSFDDLKQKLKQIVKAIKIQKRKQEIDLIKQFINYIVDEDRLFTIKKFRQGESGTRAELLKMIDKKSVWWSREIDVKKQEQIDMSKILFNITKPILVELTRHDLSKQEFIKLIHYYNFRVSQILNLSNDITQNSCSLYRIFNQLVQDAMGKPDDHEFLKPIKEYVGKYYHLYDSNYKEERQQYEKYLFGNDKDPSVNPIKSEKVSKIKDKNFIVKKFKFLKNVQQKKNKLNSKNNQDQVLLQKKSITEKVNELAKALYEMIRDFKSVAYKRKNCSEIIYKYGYIIYRIISEVQVILLLIGSASEEDNGSKFSVNKIQAAVDGQFFVLDRPLIDFMGVGFHYQNKDKNNLDNYQQLRDDYIKNVDLNSEQFKKLPINWSLIDLFSENESDDPVIVQKVIVLLEKFSQQFLSETQNKHQNLSETTKLIQRLAIARVNCSQLYELTQDEDRKTQFFFIVRRVTNNIGKLLQSIKRYDLARKVYNSIMYVDGVCNLFKNEIEDLSRLKQEKHISNPNYVNKPFILRIQYADYLQNHGREKEAIIIYQQAFELASNKNQLLEAKHQLSEALLQKGKDENDYEKKLFDGNNLFDKFEDDLIDQLQTLGGNSLPASQIM